MDDLLNQIGSRILSRRKQLRMTQEELAEKAGITSQTVSSAELGKKALRPENIIRLCSALDISTDYLLLGEINENDHSILLSRISDLPPIQYIWKILSTVLSLLWKNGKHRAESDPLPVLFSCSEMLTWYLQSVPALPHSSLLKAVPHLCSFPA